MPIAYNWIVEHMEAYKSAENKENVIFSVSWRIIAGDLITATAYGTTTIQYDENSYFIPYNQLTKDIVISWVKNVLGEERVASFEKTLADEINLKQNPDTQILIPEWQ